jgi:hypothetical protein
MMFDRRGRDWWVPDEGAAYRNLLRNVTAARGRVAVTAKNKNQQGVAHRNATCSWRRRASGTIDSARDGHGRALKLRSTSGLWLTATLRNHKITQSDVWTS